MKYNSIDEFLKVSGYHDGGFSKSKIFNFDAFDLTIYKTPIKGVAECFSFHGKSKEDCEQKLLEWANDGCK